MDLTLDVIKPRLKTLGNHPITLRHAFLELGISNCGVQNIDVLQQYSHLMYLDISQNSIEDLSVLNYLPTLVQLHASDNQITDCLDFCPPHCRRGNAWSTGHNAIGSMLTIANLANNRILYMGDLSKHRFLESLNLKSNQIENIRGLIGLQYLKILDLSSNRIANIEGLDNLPIRELYLKDNQITSLSGLKNLPLLIKLDVSKNSISSLFSLEHNANLTHLDISQNKIIHIRQVEFLKEIPWLRELHLVDNPCYFKDFYRFEKYSQQWTDGIIISVVHPIRLRVLYRIPGLHSIDGKEATPEEKVQAYNLYKSPNGDIDMRINVFSKYIPNETFVDYSPQLGEDDEAGFSFETVDNE